jgi:hypothetical protein
VGGAALIDMADTIKAWQCIGCGRLEGPAQCVGICQDQPVELVTAADYLKAVARAEALEEVVRRIAHTAPKKGQCERTWLALQGEARKALGPAGEAGGEGAGEGPLAKSPPSGQ